ncbi:MAG: UDP-N-acetylglucosamine 1-carboxyvinyltransferase [Alphaproteobacteria bacterium]
MDRIRIVGGRPLQGTIPIGGAKNAALPLMAAALLTDQDLVLGNLPDLADIRTMGDLLKQLGVEQSLAGRALTLNGGGVRQTEADYDLVRKMRASIVVLGPLVARHGRARVSLPGGCAIGARPVDYHLKGLAALGAEISLDQGYVEARAPAGLKGAHFVFPNVSVGATENLLMAATLARGDSVLENVAREPEVTDLAHCLVAMGARISGIGTDTLRITGVERLTGADHHILPDRIETGTYAIAVAMTGGRVTLSGARRDLVASLLDSLVEAGADVGEVDGALTVARGSVPLLGVDVMTEPFPGFPTDLQAQFMAAMTIAGGASMITETIFENRFMHVPELMRMGANINLHGASAMVRGVPRLTGAQVMATDLRASVSLILAGLVATGETMVNRVYHLDRGYERLEEKLSGCGASVERVPG